MTPEPTIPIWHVRKEDVHKGSARVANPPFASFDVVLRQDHEEALAVLEGQLAETERELADSVKDYDDAQAEITTVRGRLAEATEALRREDLERAARHERAEALADVLDSVVQGMDEPGYEFDPVDDGQVIRNVIGALRREALRAEPAKEGA